jgi:hypothetical protein
MRADAGVDGRPFLVAAEDHDESAGRDTSGGGTTGAPGRRQSGYGCTYATAGEATQTLLPGFRSPGETRDVTSTV